MGICSNGKWDVFREAKFMRKYSGFIICILALNIFACGCTKQDKFNYANYQHKIWILEETQNSEKDTYNHAFSFCITKLENGRIEGKISTGYMIKPSCIFPFQGELDSHNIEAAQLFNYPEFKGEIYNGRGECQFQDEDGNKGTMAMELLDENKISVSFKYTDIYKETEQSLLDGEYIFRPLNLTDIGIEKEVTINISVDADLNSWGNVQILAGKYDTGKRYYGVAYITDGNGNVFYEFEAPFRTGAEIKKLEVVDANSDGLLDVKLLECFNADDINDTEWIFLQKSNGLFYLKKLPF